ncbi:MAG: hypothetical protein OEO23_15235, partial [Gemmatimonadota bacterium]|nr:hypothetical protein [Gemmatimonadota bacterium]
SDSDARMHQLHEVVHSKALHRVELALALHRLQDRVGFSNKQLAEMLGKSAAFVSQMLGVAARVSPEILAEVQSSEPPGGIEALIQLSRVSDQEKQKKLWSLVRNERLDLKQLRKEVKHLRGARRGGRRPRSSTKNGGGDPPESLRVQFDLRVGRLDNVQRLVGILRDHLDVPLEEIVSAVQRVYDVELTL